MLPVAQLVTDLFFSLLALVTLILLHLLSLICYPSTLRALCVANPLCHPRLQFNVASSRKPEVRSDTPSPWSPTITPCLIFSMVQFSSVQLLSCVWLFVTPWTAARQASPSITNSKSLLKLTSVESVMPSNHLIFCHPLLLLPSIFPQSGSFPMSQFFTRGGQSIWVSASSISPSNKYSGLISLWMD